MSDSEAGKKRFPHRVCKPCWELKYCPYGPLVETFPLHPESAELDEIREAHERATSLLKEARGDDEILDAVEFFLFSEVSQWEWLMEFETSELSCSVFGHVCPVFLVNESATETKEGRRTGRYIPRDVMLKVVRRDGQICQICRKPVPDDQVEFDHVIPHAKGGPITPDNLRVACRECNRKKGDTVRGFLGGPSA